MVYRQTMLHPQLTVANCHSLNAPDHTLKFGAQVRIAMAVAVMAFAAQMAVLADWLLEISIHEPMETLERRRFHIQAANGPFTSRPGLVPAASRALCADC